MTQVNVSIPFVNVNINKCQCFRCPVQIPSSCVSSKITTLNEALNRHPLSRDDIPGVYCATGTASCPDIKVEMDCICGKCVVFPEYKLFNFEPNGHYCKNGNVK